MVLEALSALPSQDPIQLRQVAAQLVPCLQRAEQGLDGPTLKALMHHWILAGCRQSTCLRARGSDALKYYRRAGLHEEAGALHARLPLSRPARPWQFCEDCVPGLRSRPVWHGPGMEASDPDVRRLVEAVETAGPGIAADLQRIKASRTWPASYPGVELVDPRHESNWSKVMLFDGDVPIEGRGKLPRDDQRRLHPELCRAFAPFTCRLLEGLLPGIVHGRALPYLQQDHEQVNFFRIRPGTRVLYHSAHQNARLTLHLCLEGCGHSRTYLQVGERRLHWQAGIPIVFDDSYAHRVVVEHDNPGDRWVLHVMFVHPQINTPDRFRSHLARMGLQDVWRG